MFINLEAFPEESVNYQNIVANIEATVKDPVQKQTRLTEAYNQYKGQVRRYIPLALEIIKNTFHCDYSTYKIGKDFNADLKVVETTVPKTKSEILADMEQFRTQMASMQLSEEEKKKVNLALDVYISYNDDAKDKVDENKEEYFRYAKPIASSVTAHVSATSQTTPQDENPYVPPVADSNANFLSTLLEPQSSFEVPGSQPSYEMQQVTSPVNNSSQEGNPFAQLYQESEQVVTPFVSPEPEVPVETPMQPENPVSNDTNIGMSIFDIPYVSSDTPKEK